MGAARLAGIAAVAALAVPAAPAAAADTAEGRCEMTGVTTFDEPIGTLPQAASYSDRATGTCTGTLNGEPIVDAPVVMEGRGSGTFGCVAGGSSEFRGTMTYTMGTDDPADDVVIHTTARSAGVFTQFVGHARGAISGEAVAHLDYLPRTSDPQPLFDCRDSTVERVGYTLRSQTVTPIVG